MQRNDIMHSKVKRKFHLLGDMIEIKKNMNILRKPTDNMYIISISIYPELTEVRVCHKMILPFPT